MPDRRERVDDPAETLRLAVSAGLARAWTSLPGVVKQFPSVSDLGNQVIDVQPTINGLVRNSKNPGNYDSIQMPVLINCPIQFPGGGGVTMTFPIAAGDEGLIVLSARCIDAWWSQGWQPGPGMNPPDLRMHNLSDGFFIPGIRSNPRATFVIDLQNACLITDDGQTFFKLNPTTKAIAAQASGGINLNGVTIDSNGNVNSPATITATTDVVGGGIHLKTHTHSDPQGGNTGPPN